MRFRVIEPEEGGYRKLVATGTLPEKSGLLLQEEIRRILRESSGARLLVDISGVEGHQDIFGSILQAQQLSKEPNVYTHRIAVIDAPANKARTQDDELVLSNRGIPVRFFVDESVALKWLLR